jgi:hypothetical protein
MKLQITIPTSLSEISLEQYQKFLSIAKDNPDGEFLQHKMVEIFCGIDLKNAAKISFKDVNEITTNLSNLFNQKYDLKRTFKLGNTEFGFITNLDEITLGEYTDLDKYISDWGKMHNAMAVLYRPITKKLKDKYQIEEYNGSYTYCDAMKFMPLDVALGAVVFFYNLGNELLKSTIHYLENNKEFQNIVNNHNLEVNGVGIHHSMLLLKEMLEDLTIFPNLDFQLPLHT